MSGESELIFWYRNYRGEAGYRRVNPISLRHGTSNWHKEPQWLLRAIDLEKTEEREFAMADISDVIGSPVIAIAQPQLRDAPEGFVLVPKEPTAKMIDAGLNFTWHLPAIEIYKAMLAAAPSSSEPKLSDTLEGWQAEALHDVIVGALLEYCGTGQGVDDMLFDIASGQARGIIEAMRKFGHLQPLRDAPEGWRPIATAEKNTKARLVWCPERRNVYLVSWMADTDKQRDGWMHFGGYGQWLEEPATHWLSLDILPPSPSEPKEDKSR